MGRVVQRYLIAAIAFAVAALATGVGLVSAFECLLVFVLASLGVAVVQARSVAAERRASRSVRGRSHDRRAAGGREQRGRHEHAVSPSRARRQPYDDDADSGEWPRLAEPHW